MQPRKIADDIYWVGVNDRESELFEGLWPIKEYGVSINSYVLLDEKNVIIDLSSELMSDRYIEMLKQIVDLKKVDYVVLNHMEPDHTGAVLDLLRIAPDVIFLGTAKARDIAANFYDIRENFQVVEDGEELKIGKRTLRFYSIPFVHWPETMATYVVEDQILMPCDAFGGFGALPGVNFDDQCEDLSFMENEAARYFINIVGTHSANAKKAIEKLTPVPLKIVAPSHGLVWRENPGRIVELYRKLSSYPDGKREKAVTLIYGSMYGNTRIFAESVMQAVADQGLPVEVFDVNNNHASYILTSLWHNEGVIICAPTYEGSLFPTVTHVLNLAKIKKIQSRTAAYFGSYAWGSVAKKQVETYAAEQKWNLLENYQFYGRPKAADLDLLPAFAKKFADAVRAAE